MLLRDKTKPALKSQWREGREMYDAAVQHWRDSTPAKIEAML